MGVPTATEPTDPANGRSDGETHLHKHVRLMGFAKGLNPSLYKRDGV
jgi:hypothetical protein